MPHELDQILISWSQRDFQKRLEEFRISTFEATWFRDDDRKRDKVKDIVEDVSKRGDEAVAEYTEKFDGIKLTPEEFRVSKRDLEGAYQGVDNDLLASIRQSIQNVRKYQQEIYIGNRKHLGIKYTPIERVGVCVPGASAPLPSTVIMTAVPAIVAGVKPEDIVVISPPRYNGSIHPVILAVCHELEVKEVYRIGGAQAVAALAFGDKKSGRIKVDKIVGPGNAWVQMAKREVFGAVDIDSIAGPSEVLIIADGRANPAWIAADMLSQAEHDPGSAMLYTNSQDLAEGVLAELKSQVNNLQRVESTIRCIIELSKIVVFENMNDVIVAANAFAAEHLEIQCGEESREIEKEIENAGAIFIGDYSPVAVGDYWAGPSHTLPTGMTAKFFSPLSANDFIKSTSIIEYDQKKLAESAEDIIRLAEVEGLDAHAKSIRIRQETGQK